MSGLCLCGLFRRAMPARPSMLSAAACFVALLRFAAAQTQYFEVLEYRDPTQCERMQCMSVRSQYCREHKKGFYLYEKGCPPGQICTLCDYGNETHPTLCKCENPPFSLPVLYGQDCNLGAVCAPGEGSCFRPCDTYLHITLCEDQDHCSWNRTTKMCGERLPETHLVFWADMPKDGAYQ